MQRPVWPRFIPVDPQPPAPEFEEMPEAVEAEAAAALQPDLPAVRAVPDQEELLREARLQAAQILQEAATEAEAAVKAAQQDGYEAGYRDGAAAARAEAEHLRSQAAGELEQARGEAETLRTESEATARRLQHEAETRAQVLLAEVKEQVAALLKEAEVEQHRRLDAAQEMVLDLAVTAAMRLVQGQLALHPEAIVSMVAAGLRKLKDTNCTVRVSESDLPLLEAQRATLERELATGNLQLQPDTGMSPGNYLIKSTQGQIDGRLETQGAVLRSAMGAALGGAEA